METKAEAKDVTEFIIILAASLSKLIVAIIKNSVPLCNSQM